MKRLAPFLEKTYEMVEDPNTNQLISWNYHNQTIVIHDHINFSSVLLPLKFRHDNFSSFIYQLNNYGFRKVNNDPHEYYNKWFQPGRKDLLYNIKSRLQNPINKKRKAETTIERMPQPMKEFLKMKIEIENLKDDHKKLKIEINELKLEHEKLEKELVNAKFEEESEENMVELVMKVLSDPSFVQQVVEQMSKKDTNNLQVPLDGEPKIDEFAKKILFELKDLITDPLPSSWGRKIGFEEKEEER